jgi:hypothetical protein
VLAEPASYREACDALGLGRASSGPERAQEVAELLAELEHRGLVSACSAP